MSTTIVASGNVGGASTGSAVVQSQQPGKVFDHPSLRGIKYVIFPDNVWGQRWDFVMICAIWYFCFYISFFLGISGGYFSRFSKGMNIVNWCMNICFIVDLFVAFFRAYYDKNGRIVYSLKRIVCRYITSGQLFINILAAIPASSAVYEKAGEGISEGLGLSEGMEQYLFLLLEAFKLLRLIGIRKIMNRSVILNSIWESIPIETGLVVKHLLMMILVSHWIACIWGFIAFQEAGGADTNSLLDPNNLNWIQNWHNSSYVEGGLDPIGWENAIPRYWLCLFWSIQSITSIGYGNIAPVTTIEYGFANALMLLCGIFWAYIIGNLVDVVQQMGAKHQAYVSRMKEADQMIRDFTQKDLESSVGTVDIKTSKRIRRFITSQRDASSLARNNVCTLQEAYPTLSVLSPELQKACILHLTQSLLETIPYLSSKYLSPEEQTKIAKQCVTIEFSRGEKFVEHPDLGRGILIYRQGFGVTSRNMARSTFVWHKDLNDKPIDVNEVLLEDDSPLMKNHLVCHMVGFTKVFFVPRSAIMAVLEKNERAWKECARWRYFMAAFVIHDKVVSEGATKSNVKSPVAFSEETV